MGLTELLQLAAGDVPGAKDELYKRVYSDYRRFARKILRSRPRGDLDTTDLIHEVVLRFENAGALASFPNRRVLFSVSIRAMQQVLVDHYRRRSRLVDSPDRSQQALDVVLDRVEQQVGYDFDSLQIALKELENDSPRQFQVLNYKVFGGCTIPEIAELLEVSRQTVDRDWKLAKAKLYKLMKTSE